MHSELSRRDAGLKMLCVMLQSWAQQGNGEFVIWEIILRDFLGVKKSKHLNF
jgi:hypothetical protein